MIKYKPLLLVSLFLFPHFLHSQISGTVTDSSTNGPLQYVSIWIKDKSLGTTTDQHGKFLLEQGSPGDTLITSFLGFEDSEQMAAEDMNIVLTEKLYQLEEVVITPMKLTLENEVRSYKHRRQVRDQLFSGEHLQYRAARFFEYKSEYEQTPFLKTVSFVTMNALDAEVPVLLSLIKADSLGQPTDHFLLKNRVVKVEEGREENHIDLREEKLPVPEEGFFVVLERIYHDDNRLYNKNYVEGETIKYIYQPSFGLVKKGQGEKLWWNYGGNWRSPSELQKIFPFKDLAINVQLTN